MFSLHFNLLYFKLCNSTGKGGWSSGGSGGSGGGGGGWSAGGEFSMLANNI